MSVEGDGLCHSKVMTAVGKHIINQLRKDGKVTRTSSLRITMSDLAGISSQQQEQILKIPALL